MPGVVETPTEIPDPRFGVGQLDCWNGAPSALISVVSTRLEAIVNTAIGVSGLLRMNVTEYWTSIGLVQSLAVNDGKEWRLTVQQTRRQRILCRHLA